MRTNVPISVAALRRHAGLRQIDLGERAGVSRYHVSRAERGKLDGLTVATLARLAAALGAELVVEIRWRGAELDRLIDRQHAALQEAAAQRLAAAGWLTRAEVSFNHYGDRGRCDLVAWHPASRSCLIVEVKSRIGNVQDTLGRLDVKVRLGAHIAEEAGWGRPSRVVPALVLAGDRTTRRVLGAHATLFARFGLRARAVQGWLRAPSGLPGGLLWYERPDVHPSRTIGANRVRTGRPAN